MFALVALSLPGGEIRQQDEADPSRPPVVAPQTGRELVEATCQSCHLLPTPDLLDRRTWLTETLRYMMPWLGLSRPNYDRLPDGAILLAARLHPDEPVFTRGQWSLVVDYFSTQAPPEPPPPPWRPPSRIGIPGFRAETWSLAEGPPFVTSLKIDAARRRVLVGDGQDKSLRAVRPDGTTQWRLPVPSGPVAVALEGTEMVVTLIGRVFPSDELAGQVWAVSEVEGRPRARRLIRGLRRPVHASVVDLDDDGQRDLVVCSFGNRLGNLSWFRALPGGDFEERVVEEYPGSLRTLPTDWNGDGRTDLVLLRGQAREGLSVLLNDGGGEFTAQRLIDQPPTFGYAAMESADLDGDGLDELLLVNGDSGDYPSSHKGYHGLRVYSRTSDGGLVERCFFPMFGAYGVRAGDFDGDGDRDLALISFFPDFDAQPVESFVLLRNQGGWRFEAYTLPEEVAVAGRWLVMDAGDIDGDGDEDLVLGSFSRGPSTVPIPPGLQAQWATNRVAVLLLRNERH